MTSLTGIFASTRGATGERDKLRELYWSRAELKQEFAKLRDRTYRLREELKAREGDRLRLQQKLDQLEALLLDPDWVWNIVAFYQLRTLNESCRVKLANFAERIKQQRERKEYGRFLDDWKARRQEKIAALEDVLDGHGREVERLEGRLESERYRYARLGPVGRFVRKRSFTRLLDGIAAEIESAKGEAAGVAGKLDQLRAKQAPDTQGLDIASKRSINFMILSFAQQLYLHFAPDDLAGLSREAAEKSPGTVRYGNREDCERLIVQAVERGEAFKRAPLDTDVLQKRARLLAETAVFTAADDAVPEPASVAAVYEIAESGNVSSRDACLLSGDYWNLNGVLSR